MSQTLTFDLGTSYFKVCLFTNNLQLVARKSVAVPIVAPESGRRELPVASFCRELSNAVQDLNREAGGLRDVTKVCFTSQANSFTLLDENDSPLLPFLIWSDQRANDSEAFLQEFSSAIDFYTSTGIPQIDRQFMVAKLRWVQMHSPTIFNRSRRLCTISDYLVRWLTGNHLTEASLAGLTGLINIHRLEYRPDALRQLNLPTSVLPTIVRAGSDAGRLRPQLVDEWGLAPGSKLVMGCLDQFAGAIGAGTATAGGICETTGTVLATVQCTREFCQDASIGLFQGPASSPELYFQMVFSNLSAGILERYRNRLSDHPTFEELDRLAHRISSGADGLQFNRAADLDAMKDLFANRTPAHGRGHEVRAIMEAVAWELRGQLEALCGRDWPRSIVSIGGAAKSRLWLEIKREILGCQIEQVDCLEPTSLGAARIANCAEPT